MKRLIVLLLLTPITLFSQPISKIDSLRHLISIKEREIESLKAKANLLEQASLSKEKNDLLAKTGSTFPVVVLSGRYKSIPNITADIIGITKPIDTIRLLERVQDRYWKGLYQNKIIYINESFFKETDDFLAYKEKMNASYMQIQKREDSILNVAYQKRKKSDRAILEKAYGKWAAYIEMGYLKTGMPKNVVTKILGNPRSINKTIIGDTVHEQLVYEAGKTKYVYLENGVLTAYQTEE